MSQYIAAIDQGTTSTRCMIFDHHGCVVSLDQQEHTQIFPQSGWVEHNPGEIWERTQKVMQGALQRGGLDKRDVAAVGLANQRETTVVWERATGRPLYNAIVWQDMRTDAICQQLAREDSQDRGADRFRDRTGLPLATYFSGPKLRWILDHVPNARELAQNGEALFGTIDTFLLWHLTGGTDGGLHLTDVTNASRTGLMNLHSLNWDDEILAALDIPRAVLPAIRSSSEVYGYAVGHLAGVPIAGMLGDQHAAMLGQTCLSTGEAKNTYGTGCFLLLQTGETIVESRHGLLTTLGYKLGDAAPVYALEGSIAVAGALVQWLRDNLGLISSAPEIETLARSVPDNGGVFVVPAFSGLFVPRWQSSARGVIVGLTRAAHKGHIARAALEATAFQTREVIEAMERDSGVRLTCLKVDGGMVQNDLLMQFQADLLGVPVVRPRIAETTALGAAYAAGLAVGFWSDPQELCDNWQADHTWQPQMDEMQRETLYRQWHRAVERSLNWIESEA